MMKNFSIIFLFLLSPFISLSQAIDDSISVYIDNKVELLIILDDYDHLRDSNEVSEVLLQFQTYLDEILEKLLPETADLIKYSPDSALSIEKWDQKQIYLISDEKLKYTGLRDQAIIKMKDIEIILTTNDLQKLQNIDLVTCFKELVTRLPEKSNYPRSLYYQCINEQFSAIEEKNNIDYSSGGDVIELNVGVGASLVKNQLVGDFTFKLGLGFSKKGVYHSNPYASVNLMYDFSDGNKMHINTFLNVGHNWAIPKKMDEKVLIGLELGYLISRNGELFEENTFRFGINYALPSGFDLSPQLYMGDGFKRFYPGIRMGFSF